jgi:sensor histidine kinase YesM
MKFFRKLIHPLTIWQFLLANLLLSVIIAFFFMRGTYNDPVRILIGLTWSYSICFTQWTGPLLINHFLDKRYQWLTAPVKRTIIEIISMLGWSVSAFVLVQFIMYYLVLGIRPSDAISSISGSILITFLISLFISLTFTAVGFFKAWRRSVVRESELNAQMMSYKYESLRNQINPHFLFNSFNVLSDLVYADQAQAVKFIRQMSDLFRYILDNRDKELVSIREELNFLNAYLYLLKTRFDDKITISVNLDPAPGQYIVPMTLQLLVENAVKHNEVSARNPLNISISQNGGYIEVKNELRKKEIGDDSTKTGLKNISQQFGFFTDKKLEFSEQSGNFVVKVPIIEEAEK